MKLVSIFIFHEITYCVNFQRIDNDPHATTITTIAAREFFINMY